MNDTVKKCQLGDDVDVNVQNLCIVSSKYTSGDIDHIEPTSKKMDWVWCTV